MLRGRWSTQGERLETRHLNGIHAVDSGDLVPDEAEGFQVREVDVPD